MIRNNEDTVPDGRRRTVSGNLSHFRNLSYSPAESRFYELVDRIHCDGASLGSRLSGEEGRAVMLVLIAMQKLASSSVAAIRRAIAGRLSRVQSATQKLSDFQAQYRGSGKSMATATRKPLWKKVSPNMLPR